MTIDLSELATLYVDEHQRMRRMLIRRGMSAETASDAVQDAFLRLLAAKLAGIRDLRSYLRRSVSNAAVDIVRAERRAGETIGVDELEQEKLRDPAPLADATLVMREQIEALSRAIEMLPPRSREVLFLHKFEGLSYQETAERLGIAKNTVMVHMVKALGLLRSRLRAGDEATI
ncbi:RNA polymerase sigma factor [Ensifer sp.]|jgi:RNA polymerase sigma-70 factor (ECF subfamily)|uniref:RNA polymerase sigma factor n=1 Tax=Ensifer sp. TaxID=1872086 RepID=UPI002E0F3517|nr:RNA polymerase sigma factor [Ensifer sp.]